jgi:hypothetical protein
MYLQGEIINMNDMFIRMDNEDIFNTRADVLVVSANPNPLSCSEVKGG